MRGAAGSAAVCIAALLWCCATRHAGSQGCCSRRLGCCAGHAAASRHAHASPFTHVTAGPPRRHTMRADKHYCFGAQALSNIIYSAATMGLRPDYELLHAVAKAVAWQIEEFKPQARGGGVLRCAALRCAAGGALHAVAKGVAWQAEELTLNPRQARGAALRCAVLPRAHHASCSCSPLTLPAPPHPRAGPGQHRVGAGQDGGQGDA